MNRKGRKIVTVCFLIIVFVAAALPALITCVLHDGESARAILAWQSHARFNGAGGVLLQKKDNGCGPAALAMIFSAHNVASSVDSLERELALTQHGAIMSNLKRVAENHMLRVSAWRLTASHLRHIPLPAVLFLRQGHFVVLDSVITGNRAYLRDPAIGRITISTTHLGRLWDGETLLFEK